MTTLSHLQTLSDERVREFIDNGFVRIDEAFSRELAEEGRKLLWQDTGCDPHDPATWTKPVIRLNDYPQAPFRQAANTPRLHGAFDQLAGEGRWAPRDSLGTFPVRFPAPDEPGDTGWHVDASFSGGDGSWRINVTSRGRALLMLFLFSDVGPEDAPTRILAGSHLDVPRVLEPGGEEGLSFQDLAKKLDDAKKLEPSPNRPVVSATGEAGTVYLCHPFLVHGAQIHRGKTPRFLAQPPLYPLEPMQIQREDDRYSPVETAIRKGLALP